MTVIATLVFFPDGSAVVAVGCLRGVTPMPVLLIAVNTTPMSAFAGIFAQAKAIADAVAPVRYAPLTTISVN